MATPSATQQTELQKNATARERNRELDFYQLAQDRLWMTNRMETGRMSRCLSQIQLEANTEKEYHERTDNAAIVNAKAKRAKDLGIAIVKDRDEEIVALQQRQFIRRREPELRNLMRDLNAAYTCKYVRMQIQQKEYKKLQEKADNNRAYDTLRKGLEDEREKNLKDHLKKQQYCQELQQQLVNRQRVRECQYEDTLVEKKMLDEIMRTLADEDQKELQQKREISARIKNEMEMTKQARLAFREKQRQLIELEETAIEEQQRKMKLRSNEQEEKRNEVFRRREVQNSIISNQIVAAMDERKKREEFLTLYQKLDHEEQCKINEATEKAKRERRQKETMSMNIQLINTKKLQGEEQRKTELFYRENLAAREAVEGEAEKQKELKKRAKNKQISDELLRQVEEQHRRRKQYKVDEEARATYAVQYQKTILKNIDKERDMIIEDHMPFLLGHIQAGVVHQSDIPTIKRGVAKWPELANLNVDGLSNAKKSLRRPKCNEECRNIRYW